jgi:hypothetical protein
MTYKVSHMVHTKQMNESSPTRSISLDITPVTQSAADPFISGSYSVTGISTTIYFKTVEQLQDYVNECRLVLGEWIVESMGINDDQ